MTAVDERERAAEAVPGVPECSARPAPVLLEPGGQPELMRCPEPAVGRMEGYCGCGHFRSGWVCEEHAARRAGAYCLPCSVDSRNPHHCPLTVRLASGDGRG